MRIDRLRLLFVFFLLSFLLLSILLFKSWSGLMYGPRLYAFHIYIYIYKYIARTPHPHRDCAQRIRMVHRLPRPFASPTGHHIRCAYVRGPYGWTTVTLANVVRWLCGGHTASIRPSFEQSRYSVSRWPGSCTIWTLGVSVRTGGAQKMVESHSHNNCI